MKKIRLKTKDSELNRAYDYLYLSSSFAKGVKVNERKLLYSKLNGAHLAGRNWVSG